MGRARFRKANDFPVVGGQCIRWKILSSDPVPPQPHPRLLHGFCYAVWEDEECPLEKV